MATPSPETLLALQKLSEDPKNIVFIISGRDGGFLDQHLGHFDKIGFSAEHGCFMREPGAGRGVWTNLTKTFDMSWMQEVKEIFEYYTEVSAIQDPFLEFGLPFLLRSERPEASLS